MLRYTTWIVLATALTTTARAAAPAVEQVVVFADRAEVTRRGGARCHNDVAAISFDGLPAELDVRTLRAQAADKAKAIGVTSRVVPLDEESDARVRELQQSIRQLEQQLAALADRRSVLRNRERTLSGYTGYFTDLWSEELRAVRPEPKRWGDVLDRVRRERLSRVDGELSAATEERALQRTLAAQRRRLAAFGERGLAEVRNAEVAVSCSGLSEVQVRLSYVVGGATWHPEYDLRYTGKGQARSGEGQAVLMVSAVIQQATGEDWQQARVLLSTARPRLGAEAPKPAQLWIEGREASKQKVLVQGTERREQLKAGSATPGPAALGADLDDRGQSFVLTLPRRITVLADGRPYWFPVDAVSAKATAALVTVPKLSPYVYQVVKLDNPASYPLLPGVVHAYRHGTYVGDTAIEYRAAGEPLELSLGIDEEFKVERIELLDRKRNSGLLLQSKNLEQGYRVELTNRSRGRASVEVRERIPISKVDQVKVELDRGKTTPRFGLDPHRGFVTWNLSVEPGQTGAVELHYAIRLPDCWQVQ
ncbi:MAG: mucoidy inhibitor MuiA family protein [Deltaproteobacteria bacterium]|nr:mucoidy inhibitor MuiA family protein [Deltaproteobacteria bacterium]